MQLPKYFESANHGLIYTFIDYEKNISPNSNLKFAEIQF